MKNVSDGVRGYLFQGRFCSCVLDERHLLAAARYVEFNPVSAGLVKQVADYPWSSARFHLGVNPGDALVRDKSLLGLVDDWANISRVMMSRESRACCFEEFVRDGQQEASNLKR